MIVSMGLEENTNQTLSKGYKSRLRGSKIQVMRLMLRLRLLIFTSFFPCFVINIKEIIKILLFLGPKILFNTFKLLNEGKIMLTLSASI